MVNLAYSARHTSRLAGGNPEREGRRDARPHGASDGSPGRSAFRPSAGAQERSAAVFDFELTDTSRDDQLAPPDAEHQARLAMVSERLRTRLARVGPLLDRRYRAGRQGSARQQSAVLRRLRRQPRRPGSAPTSPITGMVYKVSNLILNMMIFVRDAKTGGQRRGGAGRHARRHRQVVDRARSTGWCATGCSRRTMGRGDDLDARERHRTRRKPRSRSRMAPTSST